MKFGIVLYSSDIALNSPSIIVRPASSAAHFRKYFPWDPSGISTLRRAVIVQADVPNLLAERIFVPSGNFVIAIKREVCSSGIRVRICTVEEIVDCLAHVDFEMW
jgi:hypothetical protein